MPQLESFETKHKINPINFEIRCATINKNNNLITRGRWVALRNPSNEHVIITKSGDLIVGGDNQKNMFPKFENPNSKYFFRYIYTKTLSKNRVE